MTPQKFKEFRGNLTLQELSDLIGISTRGIRYYESGGRAIPKPVQILMSIHDYDVELLKSIYHKLYLSENMRGEIILNKGGANEKIHLTEKEVKTIVSLVNFVRCKKEIA